MDDQNKSNIPSSFGISLWGLLDAGFSLAILATIIAFFSSFHWFAEIINSMRQQILLVLCFATLSALLRFKKINLGIYTLFLFINAVYILPIYLPRQQNSKLKSEMKVILFNINSQNQQVDEVRDYLLAEDADVIGLLEVNKRWYNEFEPLRKIYPFEIVETSEDNFGVYLLSKFPITSSEIRHQSEAKVPTILTTLQIKNSDIKFILTHPIPPVGRQRSTWRNQQLEELAVLANSDRTVLIGDLNCVPWSPYFNRLKNDSGLMDSRQGFGLHNTWDGGLPFAKMPIDHCLISTDLSVKTRSIGPNLGSDHRAVILELMF